MHPAFSVIFLTTLIGVGQGLFLALYTGELYSLANLIPVQEHQAFYGVGSGLAVLFLVGGLIASIFHLGRPERAWRAATQWRTSWLSREVIVLPLFMGFVLLYGLAHYLDWNPVLLTVGEEVPVHLSLILGALGTVSAFSLFMATGMIYACIKFLQEWHSPLTVINYTLLGGASGFTLAAAFSAFVGADLVGFYGTWAVILIVTAFITRTAALMRNRRIKRTSNLQTAIGVRHTRIEQKAEGAMGGSFNTREFFHGRSPGVVRSVRIFFLVLAFPVPVALLAAAYGLSSTMLPILAFGLQYLGLMAER